LPTACLRERETQLAQAKENLARVSDEVELPVQTAYNKMEHTRQMITELRELLDSGELIGQRLVIMDLRLQRPEAIPKW
jgi:hypothetical protein